MIGVVSSAADPHYRAVAKELDQLGQRCVLLDPSGLGTNTRIAAAFGARSGLHWRTPDCACELDQLTGVWFRRYQAPVLTPPPAPVDRDWLMREWRDAVTGMLSDAGPRCVNDPNAQGLAANKPHQLRIAQRAGLTIPETLLTNDAELARDFIEAHNGQVVHKVLVAPTHRFLATKRWSAGDAAHLESLYLSPTLFQEQVQAPYELRITIVGDRLYCARFAVPDGLIDARTEFDLCYEPHILPDAVQADLVRLTHELGLTFATVDMKLRADDSYVFLELNPQGQFLYVEIKTGLPIARAVARWLAALA